MLHVVPVCFRADVQNFYGRHSAKLERGQTGLSMSTGCSHYHQRQKSGIGGFLVQLERDISLAFRVFIIGTQLLVPSLCTVGICCYPCKLLLLPSTLRLGQQEYDTDTLFLLLDPSSMLDDSDGVV